MGDTRGYPEEENGRLRELLGAGDHEVVDLSGAGASVVPAMKNCRFIWADAEGTIKFSYLTSFGTVKTRVKRIPAGFTPWRNVVEIFKYTAGTTACTATAFTDLGVEVPGICLCR